MRLSAAEVIRLARAARLEVGAGEADGIARALDPVLEQMDRMLEADITGAAAVDGVGAAGMPLRADAGPPMPMAVTPDRFAPEWRQGLFVLPPERVRGPGRAPA